jgi:MFS family permease
LLVFDRTRSPLLAAVTYAASIVPTFVGGLALSGLADIRPRRQVMIACDLSRALLVAVMALPGIPLGVLVVLLFAVTMISAPFRSARAALYPDILPGDQFVLGTAVTLTTLQFAQVAGFGGGGAVVGFFGVRVSLLADAVTFVISAVVTGVWVHPRPRPERQREGRSASSVLGCVQLIFGDPILRTSMLLGWLVAFIDVYEGVAAPLAAALGGGAVAVGLILASGAFGASVGSIGFSRLVAPAQRLRWMGPLAMGSSAVLILFFFQPNLVLALLILTVSGTMCSYQVAASAAFVTALPPARRSQGFGIAQGGMSLAQGTAMVLAGALARYYTPSTVIAVGGALGVAVGFLIASVGSRRVRLGPGKRLSSSSAAGLPWWGVVTCPRCGRAWWAPSGFGGGGGVGWLLAPGVVAHGGLLPGLVVGDGGYLPPRVVGHGPALRIAKSRCLLDARSLTPYGN